MLKVIDDEKLIRKYAKLFARSFKPFTDRTIKVKLGHQGASFPAKVNWSKQLGIWSFSHAVTGIRYANPLGTEKPQEASHLPITAEINFPWSGIDRKTGAAFARDAWNHVYVIHRGKIGGGKKGVGKSLFEENYRGLWAWMEDGDTQALVAVIGELQSPRFALQVAQFTRKIDKLKSNVSSSPQTSLNFQDVSFREELIGATPASPVSDHLSEACDHDIILNRLASLLEGRKFLVGNDADHELFLMDPKNNRMSHVFAVSADSTSRSIMATAAYLLLQKSIAGEELVHAVLVIPEDKLIQYVQPLQRLGITVLGCRLDDARIIFQDPEKIRLDQNSRL